MSSLNLGTYQIFDIYDRQPDIENLAAQHESYVRLFGWDQAATGLLQFPPVPPKGTVFQDEVYGDVVMFPDAAGVLRFTKIDNDELVTEIRKPVFHSDPEYWEGFIDVATRFGESINLGLDWLGPAVAVAVGVALYRGIR